MSGENELEVRRRRGLDLQARLPKPRFPPRRSPRREAAETAGEGCLLGAEAAEAGVGGLVLAGFVGTVYWLARRRRNRL